MTFSLSINHSCDLLINNNTTKLQTRYMTKNVTVIFENKFILLDIEASATIVTTTDIITSRQCKIYP